MYYAASRRRHALRQASRARHKSWRAFASSPRRPAPAESGSSTAGARPTAPSPAFRLSGDLGAASAAAGSATAATVVALVAPAHRWLLWGRRAS